MARITKLKRDSLDLPEIFASDYQTDANGKVVTGYKWKTFTPSLAQGTHTQFQLPDAVLTANSVDLILTDPPYHISRDTGMQHARDTGLGNSKFHIQTKFGSWDEAFKVQQLQPFIREIYRVLKKEPLVFYIVNNVP